MSFIAKSVKSVIGFKTRPSQFLLNGLKYSGCIQRRFRSNKCDEDCVEPKSQGCFTLSCSQGGESKKSPCPSTKSQPIPLPENKISSVWDDPECLDCICPESAPKFDAYHYHMTDKKTRQYQQTWVDCPRQKRVTVIKCEFPCEEDPPIPRRTKECPKPETACSLLSEAAAECVSRDNKGACIKIRMPGCCLVRDPPRCRTPKGPSGCCKPKCPYPSFSECCKPKLRYRHPSECDCVKVRSMCEIFTVAKRKGLMI